MTVRFDAVTVDWLGHATVRLEGQTGAVVYTDPGPERVLEGLEPRDGDLILVSHGHHYDPDAIRRVARDDALVVVHESVDASESDGVDERPETLPFDVERVRADESFVLGPLDLFTTPAYNDPAGPHTDADGTVPHPEGRGCGFGVTIDGITAFWPGGTDALPLHESLEIDLLLPPIGGAVTMDRHEAASLAGEIDPDLVLPVHYDADGTLAADAEAFVVDVATRGVPVVLDE
ncbi:MBL fold metallo-hydrolase [Natrinema thermotolerans]|uniref:MBL fold metallo-hydrolase n=1 Tax=Natrinema thermotolerans TaxID=121872 RepID=A0AAF0PA33_9EURY|nr:MBL fold metallo-hydrolase [Natrinema thermotolerans]QCC60206.1 MBL fold metallo-hydrolase [Natrinema thermotolerans]QCC61116.1 MBL fold metallo-hydrolase [Natrinema thermotolerans]WMT07221.1 MBL fold metallo-hydrolase [Natrinema thermotolerans]